MFSTLPNTSFKFQLEFILSSANALNLDKSKNLSIGKDLSVNEAFVTLFMPKSQPEDKFSKDPYVVSLKGRLPHGNCNLNPLFLAKLFRYTVCFVMVL